MESDYSKEMKVSDSKYDATRNLYSALFGKQSEAPTLKSPLQSIMVASIVGQ